MCIVSKCGLFYLLMLALKRPVSSAKVFEAWWIIGVVAAGVFFILIILLIICCVKQHQGEDYYGKWSVGCLFKKQQRQRRVFITTFRVFSILLQLVKSLHCNFHYNLQRWSFPHISIEFSLCKFYFSWWKRKESWPQSWRRVRPLWIQWL